MLVALFAESAKRVLATTRRKARKGRITHSFFVERGDKREDEHG